MTPIGGRQFAWDAWACAFGVLLLGWAVFFHGDARPDLLRERVESRANEAFDKAGFGWARLRIDNTAGRLQGVAPDEHSRKAFDEEAAQLLKPYMGVPGVFLHIENQVRLNEQLPTRPPAPPVELDADLLASLSPPGAGRSKSKGPTLDACEKAFQTLHAAQPIRFKAGSAQLEPAAMPFIQQLAALASRCSQWKVVVEGHTDSSGDKAKNDRLSSRRAAAVVAAMILEGVPVTQLQSVGRGDSDPLKTAGDDEASAANRRIEFHVAPMTPATPATPVRKG